MEKQTSYERIANRLLNDQPKPAKFAKFIDGRLLVGTKSLHKTRQSRTWRLFWRLKTNRAV